MTRRFPFEARVPPAAVAARRFPSPVAARTCRVTCRTCSARRAMARGLDNTSITAATRRLPSLMARTTTGNRQPCRLACQRSTAAAATSAAARHPSRLPCCRRLHAFRAPPSSAVASSRLPRAAPVPSPAAALTRLPPPPGYKTDPRLPPTAPTGALSLVVVLPAALLPPSTAPPTPWPAATPTMTARHRRAPGRRA